MSAIRRLVTCGLLALWAMVAVPRAWAASVIPPDFNQLVDEAEQIFSGKVSGIKCQWRMNGGNRSIVTLVTFKVLERYKGNGGPEVTLQFLGGTVGDVTMEVSAVPAFTLREETILFVEKNGVQFCPLVAADRGKFKVTTEKGTGRKVVLTHDGRALADVAEIGAEKPADTGGVAAARGAQVRIGVEEFRRKISERVARPGVKLP